MIRTICLIAALWLALVQTALSQTAGAAVAPAPVAEPREEAPVVVWNRTVHVFPVGG